MSKPETITLDDVQYVRADTIKKTEGDIKIVVADRGYVFVGRIEETNDTIVIHNAKNIRKWGTSKGLGELASGPLSSTVLDDFGTVRLSRRAFLFFVDVEQAKWNIS